MTSSINAPCSSTAVLVSVMQTHLAIDDHLLRTLRSQRSRYYISLFLVMVGTGAAVARNQHSSSHAVVVSFRSSLIVEGSLGFHEIDFYSF